MIVAENLELLSDTLSSAVNRAPSSLSVDIRLHLTRGFDALDSRKTESEDDSSVKDGERNASPSTIGLGSHLYSGRPNLSKILHEEIGATRGGGISVNGTLTFTQTYQHQRLMKLRKQFADQIQ